jgi:hypothetical protein
MVRVVKKKKKPLLASIIKRLKGDFSPSEQGDIISDVPFSNISANDDKVATINSRRNELKTVRYHSMDAMVTFDGNN